MANAVNGVFFPGTPDTPAVEMSQAQLVIRDVLFVKEREHGS